MRTSYKAEEATPNHLWLAIDASVRKATILLEWDSPDVSHAVSGADWPYALWRASESAASFCLELADNGEILPL